VRHLSGSRLVARLDTMVAAGRITDEEAARLRAAADSGTLHAEAQRIQRRHAKARLEAAVADGRMTPGEAAALVARLDSGEDPRFLRGLRPR
jgi:hypothetical protein